MVVQSKSGPAQLRRDKGQLEILKGRFQQDFGAQTPSLTHTQKNHISPVPSHGSALTLCRAALHNPHQDTGVFFPTASS